MSTSPHRILIAGLGSIGRRHAAAARRVLPDAGIVVLRRPGRDLNGLENLNAKLVHSLEEALAEAPRAAVVAGPAPSHVASALALTEKGVHLLVEKPLSDRPDGVEKLLALCKRKGLVLQVGYCLRFDPALAALCRAVHEGAIGRLRHLEISVGQYLPDWRPGTDWRQGVSAQAVLGGGALNELSHEIDTARWIGGEITDVTAQIAKLGDFGIDVEDTADLLLGFENGARATLHLDFLQRRMNRTCKAIGSEGTALWDGVAHQSLLYRAARGSWEVLAEAPGLNADRLIEDQFRHFMACIEHGDIPLVSGTDGARVMAVIDAARRAAREQRTVKP